MKLVPGSFLTLQIPMTIKRLICGLGLFLTIQSCPSFAAESSTAYQYYLNEGVKAFESHNDEEASRYFVWAHEIDPSAKEPEQYSKALNARQRLENEASEGGVVYFPYLEEMLQKGKDALQHQDYISAKQYFYTAHLLDRNAAQPLEYLNLVKRLAEGRVVVEPSVVTNPVVAQPPVSRPEVVPSRIITAMPKSSDRVVASALDQLEKPVPAKAVSSRTVSMPKAKKPIEVISIEEVLQHAEGGRALLKIDLGSSLIVEGKNIKKFLVVTEGPVAVKIITRDQIQIDTQKIGVTFIHIWDDLGRRTIYVQVVFPPPPEGEMVMAAPDADHARPFRVNYSNDWSSYYSGPDVRDGA
jgi:hypothetical protein